MSFNDLALHPLIQQALAEGDYTEPTPVQAEAIPPGLLGRDVLATAATGTGKTAAFLLPSLSRIAFARDEAAPMRANPGAPRILVLAPTRELAGQVTQAVRKYGKFMRLSSVDVVGGMPYRDQLRMLARPVDVVVATPGRLIDHLQRDRIDLSAVEVLILDEADRMLDMGFAEDVDTIAAACPAGRQTMLFTATLDRRMSRLAERLLNDPVRVAVASSESSAQIEQRLHYTDDMGHKRRLLHHVVAAEGVGKAIVFAATKRDADALAQELAAAGHAAAPLHGDMNQNQRNRTLSRLRSGEVRLVVATDVAARGIDVRDITHVINFDLPKVAEDYVHRIGRTGRAGATGIAVSFAGRADRELVARIERYTRNALPVHVIPGLEPRGPRPFTGGAPSYNKGGPSKPGAPKRPGFAPRSADGQRSGDPSRGDAPRRTAADPNRWVTPRKAARG